MDYTESYTADFYAEFVDPVTWADTGKIEIIDGTASRSSDNLRQSAELTATDYEETQERWVRVYMDAIQGSNVSHDAIFTGLATTPAREIDGTIVTKTLACYSVLKPCDDILLPRGWYAPAGANGAKVIKDLLKYTPAPVIIADGAPDLSDHIIAEDNETPLTMIDTILTAINWKMQISGDGAINLSPLSDNVVAAFSPDGFDIVQQSLSVSRDWFDCPNVFRAEANGQSRTARDESSGVLSISSRGREVWMADDDAELASNETLAEYAERRLKEEQQIEETVSYTRAYLPDVNVGDRIELNYDEIQGTYEVTSQSIELTFAGETEEEVKRV